MEEFRLRDIGKRIKTARKAKKKTQDEIAEAVGITKKKNAIRFFQWSVNANRKQNSIAFHLNFMPWDSISRRFSAEQRANRV